MGSDMAYGCVFEFLRLQTATLQRVAHVPVFYLWGTAGKPIEEAIGNAVAGVLLSQTAYILSSRVCYNRLSSHNGGGITTTIS
jgi:hypothetical protein